MQQDLNNIYLEDFTQDYDYSKYKNIEGFILDDDLKRKFAPIARKLNLSQESVEMLLDIALQMSQKQCLKFETDAKLKHEDEIAGYNRLFCEDKEIPDKNSQSFKLYMSVANKAYSEFCSSELKEIFKKNSLIYHPELIKMFHHIGELAQEDSLNYSSKPAFEDLTPAQILYGQRD